MISSEKGRGWERGQLKIQHHHVYIVVIGPLFLKAGCLRQTWLVQVIVAQVLTDTSFLLVQVVQNEELCCSLRSLSWLKLGCFDRICWWSKRGLLLCLVVRRKFTSELSFFKSSLTYFLQMILLCEKMFWDNVWAQTNFGKFLQALKHILRNGFDLVFLSTKWTHQCVKNCAEYNFFCKEIVYWLHVPRNSILRAFIYQAYFV